MGEAKRRKRAIFPIPPDGHREGSIPTRERHTLADEWKDFYEKTMRPRGVPVDSTQYVETRRAYYAGASSFMALLATETDQGPDLTKLDLDYIDALQAEFDQFAIDLAEGRA